VKGNTRRWIAVNMILAVLLSSGCSSFARKKYDRPEAKEQQAQAIVPIDIAPYLDPAKKYLGVAIDKVPTTMTPLAKFNKTVGKKSNLVKIYQAWGSPFDTNGAKAIWASGAIPFIEWEQWDSPADIKAKKPSGSLFKRIASGDKGEEDYAFQFASDIAKLNIPVVISMAHEFNGDWYPWGYCRGNSDAKDPACGVKITPAEVVKAWQLTHDVFQKAAATNVIWAWTPNISIGNTTSVKLKPFYPGDGYVDWVGMVGYYSEDTNSRSFKSLFLPTMTQIRKFAKKKPFIVAETGSSYEPTKAEDINDLFSTVASTEQLIGLLWFNYKKPAEDKDWRIQTNADAVSAYRKNAGLKVFGFDPKEAATVPKP
jgi:hypothetical protein